MDTQPNNQPGDPDQLALVIQAAEHYYESSRQPIIVYWDETVQRYRFGYESIYEPTNNIEVVIIPK